jgi:UDP-N-acetylmuramoylalanine--D-glutamate ligase
MELSKRRIAVIGLGTSGVSASKLLCREGAEVLAFDRRSEQELSSALAELRGLPVRFTQTEDLAAHLREIDGAVVSPGVPLGCLPVTGLRSAGIWVIGEIELASRFISVPLIAITGTNGKSTTTSLVGEILKASGWRVFVGGNLGPPLCEAVRPGAEWDFVVAEVSSFQLESIERFHPRIGALLNLTPDHLDRYPDLGAYRAAKERVFENQAAGDDAVINADDPALSGLSGRLRSNVLFFSRRLKPSDRGLFVDDEQIVSTLSGRREPILPVGLLSLPGAHNLENALAASLIALLCGCPAQVVGETLSGFSGLPHRMEFVREVDGVRYINDSKGTNVGALTKSLEGIGSPIILIAGGRDKGGDFAGLKERVRKNVRRAILIGEAREAIREAWEGTTDLVLVESLKEAVFLAASSARPGETILLSPGCASFDQFLNFEDRGEQFKKLVRGL